MRSTAHDSALEFNSILSLLDSTYLSPNLLAMPEMITLGISNICDMKCTFCLRQHGFAVDNKCMDYRAFEALAPKLIGIRQAMLMGHGEPLLNSQFLDYARLCHKYSMETITTTHGMHLSETMSEALIEEGFEALCLSLDAVDQPTLDRLRPGVNLRQVCQKVSHLRDMRDRCGKNYPMLIINCTVSAINQEQMPDMVRLAHEIGVTTIFFSNLYINDPRLACFTIQDKARLERQFEMARSIGNRLGVAVHQVANETLRTRSEPTANGKPHGCQMAWSRLWAGSNGRTVICCNQGEDEGNIFNQSIDEAMNVPSKKSLRAELIQGQIRDVCSGCPELVANSRQRVVDILHQSEARLNQAQKINPRRKIELRERIRDYRMLAEIIFPPNATNCGLLGQVARKTLPQPVRSRMLKLFRRCKEFYSNGVRVGPKAL